MRYGLILPVLSLALVACSIAPLQQDQTVRLAPGQGLAAVTFDTLDPLTHVVVASKSGFTKLEITDVPAGQNIYLFTVPAGEYCFTRFQFSQWSLTARSGHDLACFTVVAGGLAYSGTLAPRVEGKNIVNHQVPDPPGFRILLQQQYPQVARQFPAPPDAP